MGEYLKEMMPYWEKRFNNEEKIWGVQPSKTAEYAAELFVNNNVQSILVPGSGYGRNTKLFSSKGFSVEGIEISRAAFDIALKYDPGSKFHNASVIDIELEPQKFDAIYCFNVLHLFRENERKLFINKCFNSLKNNGFIFFCVFSDKESSYGKGNEVEPDTFESKQGRPVHYFKEQDLKEHFSRFNVTQTGLIEDFENHGEEGEHTHLIRYIFAQKNGNYEFGGEK